MVAIGGYGVAPVTLSDIRGNGAGRHDLPRDGPSCFRFREGFAHLDYAKRQLLRPLPQGQVAVTINLTPRSSHFLLHCSIAPVLYTFGIPAIASFTFSAG